MCEKTDKIEPKISIIQLNIINLNKQCASPFYFFYTLQISFYSRFHLFFGFFK